MTESPVDRELSALAADGSVPGIVAGATDRRGVVYRGAFGIADVATRQPMRADAVFRIASMTKLITTIVVLQLAERGLVDLDTAFRRYFPSFRQPPVLRSFDAATLAYEASPAAREITVRELLTHTAGYGYWFLNPELNAFVGRGEPEFYNPPFLVHAPGTRFQYGISTDVLGQLLAPLTGTPLDVAFAQRVFEPLEMTDTSFEVPAEPRRLVALHRREGGRWVAASNEARGEPPRGGGGLYSTVDDYLAVLRMLLNGGRAGGRELLGRGSVAALARGQIGALPASKQTSAAPEKTADFEFMDGTQTLGFGVLIETRARPGGRAAGSYGWGGIFNTYFWVDPAAELAAVIFMQVAPFCAPICIEACERFERALYRQLRPRA